MDTQAICLDQRALNDPNYLKIKCKVVHRLYSPQWLTKVAEFT